MKMSNEDLERIAVHAIRAEAIKPFSKIKAEITEGDKGISFDGDLHVFNDHSCTVKSLVGKVPVQVKGTQVNVFTNGNRTFSLLIDHYRNFYNNHGVVLFVVEILETGQTKIFYKQLLAKELNEIIKVYGTQKKQNNRSVELRPLDETTLYAICKKLIDERVIQPTYLVENYKSIGENEYTSFVLTSLTFNPNRNETSNIFEHDFTMYGVKGNLKIPLHHTKLHSLATEGMQTVTVDTKQFEFNIETTLQLSRTILLIEKSLKLELIKNKKDNKLNFRLLRFYTLESQLKVIPFLIDFLTGEEIYIAETPIKLGKGTSKHKQFVNKLQKIHLTLLDLQKVFHNLSIEENVELDVEDSDLDNIYFGIDQLNRMLLYKEYQILKVKEPDKPNFINYKLGEILFSLFYDPFSDTRLINTFSDKVCKMSMIIDVDDIGRFDVSPYLLLDVSTLAYSVNCNIEIIKESFKELNPFENDYVFNQNNNFCLKCIAAFDLSKNAKLLELAEYIYDAPKGTPSEMNNVIMTINKLQIQLRRNGQLTDDEYRTLVKLKSSHIDNVEIQFCTSVLLENKKESELIFQQLDKEKQMDYKSYPIYTLYKKMISLEQAH
jgi:hypothetical protein